jgi:hydroxymethylglutaryl-CoA synthase
MYVAYSHVKAGEMEYGLGIGADTSQGAPGDALEYTASAGGAAFIMGSKDVAAEILHTYSFTSDTPDFWRREGEFYPRHAGRFTGEPAYFHHVLNSAGNIMEKAGMKAADFKYAVFHMPNGKFPLKAGKTLGFTQEQLEQGWVVNLMGNTYSGSSPTGLAAILDVAKSGDHILMTSFGSGAGSDSFIYRCTDRLEEIQDLAPKVRDQLADRRIHLDYGKYVAYRGKIRVNEM